ncbi:cytochrome b-c1 complex subunit 8 [Mycena alexandri]|uniref:Cytochrome b-c1 complex subunit 8 n=1 Tax=Mycena alexandri TaxID=1745969 RepID=A0AAD6XB67_9AGAR|nr:cytochrome b-c1 complex subunit 8 [Mycena alexandri]
MRPSNAVLSDMPGPKVYNLWWGDRTIQKQKGIYQYTLSPYQSKAAPNMFRNYLFNGFRRLSVYALPIIVPAGIYYYVWKAAVKDYNWRNSKEGHIALAAAGHNEE